MLGCLRTTTDITQHPERSEKQAQQRSRTGGYVTVPKSICGKSLFALHAPYYINMFMTRHTNLQLYTIGCVQMANCEMITLAFPARGKLRLIPP